MNSHDYNNNPVVSKKWKNIFSIFKWLYFFNTLISISHIKLKCISHTIIPDQNINIYEILKSENF